MGLKKRSGDLLSCRGHKIARDIALGLAYLHTSNIVHLDIKYDPEQCGFMLALCALLAVTACRC